MGIEYMSVTDVAKRLGISTAAASAYKLPQPDATIGRTRGWLPETIDRWNASRPGSNRLAIMVATGTARKPNDHGLDVAKNDMKLISNATANKPALTHMPLRL